MSAPPPANPTLADHQAIHETCTFCPKLCRFACPVAEAEARETVTPWALMTRADDVRRGAIGLDAATAETWAHCTGCGRCTQICKHDNPVAAAIFAARAEAVAQGTAPSALTGWGASAPSPSAAFDALHPGEPTQLFPGHADDAQVRSALAVLSACGVPVGRPRGDVRRSGVRAHQAGDAPAAVEQLRRARAAIDGAETVICLDANDAIALASDDGGPAIVDFITFVAARMTPPLKPIIDGDVLYLDACSLGRGRGEYDAARAALRAVIGGAVLEATMNRAEGGCCGAGAGFAASAPGAARQTAREFAQDVASVPVVIAQGACAAHLKAALAPRPVYALTALLARAIAPASA